MRVLFKHLGSCYGYLALYGLRLLTHPNFLNKRLIKVTPDFHNNTSPMTSLIRIVMRTLIIAEFYLNLPSATLQAPSPTVLHSHILGST